MHSLGSPLLAHRVRGYKVLTATRDIAVKPFLREVPFHDILVLIAHSSNDGSGEPAHMRRLARTFAAHIRNAWIVQNFDLYPCCTRHHLPLEEAFEHMR